MVFGEVGSGLAGSKEWRQANCDMIHAGGGILCLHNWQRVRKRTLKSGRQLEVQLPARSTTLYGESGALLPG